VNPQSRRGLLWRTAPAEQPTERCLPTTVLCALDGDGRQRHLVELARQLDPSRFRIVFTFLPEPASAARLADDVEKVNYVDEAHHDEAHHDAAHYVDEDHGRLRTMGFALLRGRRRAAFALRFRRLLRDVEPDVVHIASSGYAPVMLAVARMARVGRRVVYLPSTTRSSGTPARVRRELGRRVGGTVLDAWATDLVGESEVVMRQAWGEEWRLDPRCRLIYPGVAIEPFGVAIAARRRALDVEQSPDSDVVTVVQAGVGGPAENWGRAVDVLGALRGRGVNARLRIAGYCDAAQRQALATQALRRDAAGHLEFVGSGTQTARLLVAASMTLLTSPAGGGELPRVILESCAVGTPVLSADLPAVREIARLLPGVTMLPLGADDEVWADTARALTAVPPTLDERREALRMFVRSPFTAANWQREMTILWS
jgi:glycosyltransferase involved in cell wall biosynthesis